MTREEKRPLVSVLIPVFNGAEFLVETVESIYRSSYRNFEIILVDDGSTDASVALCEKLDKRFKKVRFYAFPKNKGLTRVLNFGISKARGKYVARINQDDLMVKKRLKWQVEFLESNPGHVAVGGYTKWIDKEGKRLDTVKFPLSDEKLREQWMVLSPFADPAVMYRKVAVRKTRGYMQSYWPVDDVQMWYQLGRLGKLANLPKILTLVRWYDGAGSVRFHKLQMKKVWKTHMYARKQVRRPNVMEWGFWLGQLVAGWVLPARVNWYVYRVMRRWQNMEWKPSVSLPRSREVVRPSFVLAE